MVGNSPNYSIMPHFTTQSQRQPRFLVWHSLRKTDSIKREHLWLLSSKKFSKMSLSVGSTWRSASFCFISFGVHNVTQRGIMEKGNLKAPPPTAGWPSHALLLSRDSNPVCLSVAQKMHPQLRWAERKITAYVFLLFFYFNQHPLPYLLVSALNFLWVCVSFFMAFLDSTASAVLNLFLCFFFTLKSEEEFNRELYSNVYLLFNLYLQLYLLGFCQADSTIFILYLVVTQTKFHCGQKFCWPLTCIWTSYVECDMLKKNKNAVIVLPHLNINKEFGFIINLKKKIIDLNNRCMLDVCAQFWWD